MALDILHVFGLEAMVNVTHQLKHDLESIIYVLVWICVLYLNPKSPEHQPLKAHNTCLRMWTSCKMCADIEVLWSMKMGELVTQVPLQHFTPYFQGLVPYMDRLYAFLTSIPFTHLPLTHNVFRDILLNAFFGVQEPSTDLTHVWRNLGITVLAKHRVEAEVHMMKQSRH